MIHIYYMNLDGDCSYEQSLALFALLPEDRKKKVRNAGNREIAKNRLYTGAFLQYVLSRETGITADALSYTYGKQGKPELDYHKINAGLKTDYGAAGEPVCFNLSHSGKYVVIAVSDCEVGIDIEHKKKNCLMLAKRCFCDAEYRDIAAAPTAEEQEKRFLEYWTMKEAFVKYSGEGLHIPLNSFHIVRQETGISYIECQDIWLASLFLETEQYCISICGKSLFDVDNILKNSNGTTGRIEEVLLDKILIWTK